MIYSDILGFLEQADSDGRHLAGITHYAGVIRIGPCIGT
jgi:hypothetical protein